MKTVTYKASTRGHANHGWLNANHTFSFANYYNRARMNFGLLRVLNDDIIAGGMGFGTHPHDNMEIITIPLKGALKHQDSMGYSDIIKAGEVQVMSAGSGITHSEFNGNKDEDLNLFQIWIFPNKENVEPRYDQKLFDSLNKKNELTLLVSPNGAEESLWIHQDAWLSMGTFDNESEFTYSVHSKGNGVFAMIVDGEFSINNTLLSARDGMGIENSDAFDIKVNSDNARILFIEVPMTFE